MARVRTDNVFGTTTDNPLTNVATTMNSAGLANLAAVSSKEAIIILDPNRLTGAPEIVVVTAHTGAATSATIQRGQFGTTARQHAQGTEWVHGPIAGNATTYATAADDQGDYVPMDAWETYTPTLTQSGAVAKTVNYARFARLGRTIVAAGEMTVTGAGTAGVGIVIGLPVAASFGSGRTLGGGSVFDASAGLVYTAMPDRSGSTTTFRLWPTSTDTNNVLGAAVFTAALAAGDVVDFHVTYEAAA